MPHQSIDTDFISFEKVPEEKRGLFTDRLVRSAQEYVEQDSSRYERAKLSPLLGKLLVGGTGGTVDYFWPKVTYDFRKHPDWVGFEVTREGEASMPAAIVTVRQNAVIGVKNDEIDTEVNCTVVGALSFRPDIVPINDLIDSGVSIAAQMSDLPIVGIEKTPKSRETQGRLSRFAGRLLGASNDISAEEIGLREVMGEPAFVGEIVRDDMNGFFKGSEYGTLYSPNSIPELTTTV